MIRRVQILILFNHIKIEENITMLINELGVNPQGK